MSFMDVMIDIETIDNSPTSCVVSIGMLEFNPDTGHFGRERYMVLDGDDQLRAGATVNMDTLTWWIRDNAAMWPYLEMDRDASTKMWSAADAAAEVRSFCEFAPRIWAHGPHFDIAILNMLGRRGGFTSDIIKTFWKVRDTRTFLEVTGGSVKRVPGQHHNALEDCRAQALAVINANLMRRTNNA